MLIFAGLYFHENAVVNIGLDTYIIYLSNVCMYSRDWSIRNYLIAHYIQVFQLRNVYPAKVSTDVVFNHEVVV